MTTFKVRKNANRSKSIIWQNVNGDMAGYVVSTPEQECETYLAEVRGVILDVVDYNGKAHRIGFHKPKHKVFMAFLIENGEKVAQGRTLKRCIESAKKELYCLEELSKLLNQ